MKKAIQKFSWFLGVLGLVGILLQSLQVQVEHTHLNGRVPHSHSHNHSHSHGHPHHHHHSSQPAEMTKSPQTHIHVALLWWEFTLNVDANIRSASKSSTEVTEEIHLHPKESSTSREYGPSLTGSRKTHGPLISTPHWSQLISEWYSTWHSVLPPSKNGPPIQQDHLWAIIPVASCYQSINEPPPVPPPETSLSVSFS